ncbi:hypothetical protein SCA6_002064 [Theobroma cacao]
MASRVISRRRSCIFSSPIRPTSLIRGFSWFEHRLSSTSEDSRGSGWLASHPYQNTDSKKVALPSVPNNELSYFLAAQFHRSNSFGISKSGYQVGNLDFVSPLGLRWFSQSARFASTATAGQPQLGSGNDGSEQQAPKKVKEASPEECDQAVEGLSTVKAKAKAKQVQDSPKSAQSIIKKVWAAFLGIGPALRTVASMSREDWAKKLRHWKDEFKSTMQHYWLGTNLYHSTIYGILATVKEMAKEIQNSRSGDVKKTAEDLDEFMNKVRTGAGVSNDEILGFAKLFNDELTLDNISRPRLVNMCKYMGISPYGTDAYLRYMLRKRLQEIKNDDKMIQAEGVESLSEAELRQACRDRGLLGLLSVEEMRQQLRDWLDLSLNHSVPSSLLILSRAFSVSGKVRPEEAVQATLSSLPDEVVDTVGVTALPSEDSVSERRRKLEFLEMQEELIKEEEEEEEEEQAKLKESISNEKDVALEEMAASTAKEAQELAKAKTLEKHEQLCELSRALAVLASASSVSREREEFLRLVKKEIQLYNSMVEKEGTKGEEEAKKAYKAAREDSDRTAGKAIGDKVSSALIDRVDAMLQKLEKEIDDVDAKIGDHWRLLDRDYDGKVTPEEVASAAMYLKDTLGKEGSADRTLLHGSNQPRLWKSH